LFGAVEKEGISDGPRTLSRWLSLVNAACPPGCQSHGLSADGTADTADNEPDQGISPAPEKRLLSECATDD
jgi:hypothetical protein